MSAQGRSGTRVLVRGAGIVGLAVADELTRRGHVVRVVDPSPGSGASYAAAGMLSPSAEVWWGEEVLLDLGVRSAGEWPAWASRLGVDLHPRGTLLVGHDHGDLQQVERQAALLARLGRAAEPWTAADVRHHEPTVGRVAGGLHLPEDHAVDPRAVVAALLARVPVAATVAATVSDGFRPDVEVVATGAVLPGPWAPLVRGVRGEVLRLRTDDPPTRVLRGWVRGEPVYVVPRGPADRLRPVDACSRTAPAAVEVVVGATSEEHDAPPVVTVGGVARLLDAVRTLLPGLERAELVEATARDRPATPDHLPLVGPAPGHAGPGAPRLLLAAGLFRHGVLLAPLVARLVADQVEHDVPPEPALDPRRLTHLLAPTDRPTDGPTDRPTDRPTDGPTASRTEGDTRAPARAQR
ncbi:FAD-dependent oxidoreductase [Nocardioides zeae]|uniref:Glycine oxidase n=1 Tax=Nocardioides zeae TaxID=1457234 RepID=A0AAJ1U5G8_9ACTN|nr:FAD-dependent oxidoreductase [Nocardioides zeae]MDQ1104507.1 glycine oxidase [Nocardioides zeae]